MQDETKRLIKIMDTFIVQLNRLVRATMEQAKREDLPADPLAVAICFDMLTFVVSMSKDFGIPPDALAKLLDMARSRSEIDDLRESGQLTAAAHKEILKDIIKPFGFGEKHGE